MNLPTRAGAALIALSLSSAPLVAGGPSGQMLAQACTGCHGTDGRSQSDIPDIQGKTKEKLVEELLAFRSGEKESTLMQRIAKGYSDDEIERIAEYLSQVQ